MSNNNGYLDEMEARLFLINEFGYVFTDKNVTVPEDISYKDNAQRLKELQMRAYLAELGYNFSDMQATIDKDTER